MTALDLIDDLFAEARAPHARGLIRRPCAVCGLSTRMPVTGARLCDGCRADPSMTAARVAAQLAAAEQACADAWDRWHADVAHADEATRARYARFSAAQEELAQAATVARVTELARTQRERPADTALAVLIRGELAYQDAHQRWEERRAWAARARDELEDLLNEQEHTR